MIPKGLIVRHIDTASEHDYQLADTARFYGLRSIRYVDLRYSNRIHTDKTKFIFRLNKEHSKQVISREKLVRTTRGLDSVLCYFIEVGRIVTVEMFFIAMSFRFCYFF